MKKLIIIIIIILAAGIITAGCSKLNTPIIEAPPQQPQEQPVQVEQEEQNEQTSKEQQEEKQTVVAPDFELETLDGTKIKLSETRDKNVLLNFWATWCGYCVLEMPDLQKLQEAYKDDLLILTVNVGESKETVEQFMKDNNLDLTVVLDEKMNVANTYGVRSYPTTVAINKKGEVISGYIGMLTYEQMEQLYSFFEQ